MKLVFIGGGNMAQAIIGGLLADSSHGLTSADIRVVEPLSATRDTLRALNGCATLDVLSSIDDTHATADIIVLAVKPQMMAEALSPLKGKVHAGLVLSIAAGVRCADIGALLGANGDVYANVVRCMPNTPALIRAGVTGLYATPGVSAAGRAQAEHLLAAVGKTLWVKDEALLDAVTAVSGSGPAYVFYFLEALESAAISLGFEPSAARLLATETFLGGAKLAATSVESAATLRARVTSKRGTTEAAIACFKEHNLDQGLAAGVNAAAARSKALGDELAASFADHV